MLPDDVLLETFDFYVDGDMDEDFESLEKPKNTGVDNTGTRVDAGELSSFKHPVASTCNSFVHPKHLRWTLGHLAAFASHHSQHT